MVSQTVRYSIGAFVYGVLIILIPTLITPGDVVSLGTSEGNLTLRMVELVALVVPALALFTQALLQFSYNRVQERGSPKNVGPFGPRTFRAGVLVTVAGSSTFLTLGLISLLVALELPDSTWSGVGMILIGLVFIPALMTMVGLLTFKDS